MSIDMAIIQTMNISSPPLIKPILDPKRRNDLVAEAFYEQKDILLDMLEAKLKEVHEKRKKKSDHESGNGHEPLKCEEASNVDIMLKSHGISAIGDTNVRLKYGDNGNGTLSLDATGISNVGKAHVELGVNDGTVHIPGLNDLFAGNLLKTACENVNQTEADHKKEKPIVVNLDDIYTRRFDKSEDVNTKLPVDGSITDILNKTGDVKLNDENNIDHSNGDAASSVVYSTTSLDNKVVKATINETSTTVV